MIETIKQIFLFAAVVVGFPALLCWLGDMIDKRRKNPRVAGVLLLILVLPTLMALYLFVIHSIENGFQWAVLLKVLLVPIFIIGAILWVMLSLLAPDIINVTWKSITEKFTKNP